MPLGLDTHSDWRWLAGTHWYVTEGDLPALQLAADGSTLAWLVDQTVWRITGFQGGYFWGVTAVVLRDADADEGRLAARRGPRIGHRTMIGTVTPSGQVQITFTPTGHSPLEPTVGFGQMVKQGAVWAFEMQMSTDRLRSRVLHWANMVQTRPGEPSWERLPGLDLSVPEMLEGAAPPRFADPAD